MKRSRCASQKFFVLRPTFCFKFYSKTSKYRWMLPSRTMYLLHLKTGMHKITVLVVLSFWANGFFFSLNDTVSTKVNEWKCDISLIELWSRYCFRIFSSLSRISTYSNGVREIGNQGKMKWNPLAWKTLDFITNRMLMKMLRKGRISFFVCCMTYIEQIWWLTVNFLGRQTLLESSGYADSRAEMTSSWTQSESRLFLTFSYSPSWSYHTCLQE